MTTATFYFQTDMRTFAGYDSAKFETGGGGGSGSSTEYDIDWKSGFYDIVKGTGLSGYGAGLYPNSGTVTDWELGIREVAIDPLDPFNPIVGRSALFSFTGFSAPALDFQNGVYGDGAHLATYMPTLLSGDDTVKGSKDGDYLLGYNGNDLMFGFGGNDVLEGGIGNDTLDGGAGNDQMFGGAGDDIYIVDSAGDAAIELGAGDGIDLVKSSVTFSLGANVEKLQLTGSAAISGSGNGLNNLLNGNSSDNLLDGNGGADVMNGGLGNDTYVVDNAADNVVENSGAGTDLVKSFINYTLGTYVEKLALLGTSAVNGTGNALNNVINGNSAANILDGKSGADTIAGAAGNDTIIGGLGNDQLSGGLGADKFVFDTALASNFDRMTDFSAVDDTIQLDQSIFSAIGLGTLGSSAFYAGTAAHDADDRIIYDNATGRIWYDADGNGAGAAVLFAQVNAGAGLTNVDFFVQP